METIMSDEITNIFDSVDDDLAQIESDLGNQTFNWNGEDYYCIPSTIHETSKTVTFGTDDKNAITLTVRLNQFTDGIFPKVNDTLTFSGLNLKITDIDKPAVGKTWELICNDPNLAYRD